MKNRPFAYLRLALAVAGIFVGSVLFIAGITSEHLLAGCIGGVFLGVSIAVARLQIKVLQGKP